MESEKKVSAWAADNAMFEKLAEDKWEDVDP
jgi:hypothetical protein